MFKKHSRLDRFSEHGYTSLGALPQSNTFQEALAALIYGAGHGEPGTSKHFIQVTVEMPFQLAMIRLGANGHLGTAGLLYPGGQESEDIVDGDLMQRRSINTRTLETLGKLIATTETAHG